MILICFLGVTLIFGPKDYIDVLWKALHEQIYCEQNLHILYKAYHHSLRKSVTTNNCFFKFKMLCYSLSLREGFCTKWWHVFRTCLNVFLNSLKIATKLKAIVQMRWKIKYGRNSVQMNSSDIDDVTS
jgi:hypothetical protein